MCKSSGESSIDMNIVDTYRVPYVRKSGYLPCTDQAEYPSTNVPYEYYLR